MVVRTKDYTGMIVESVRVYSNDPHSPRTILGVKAFVKAPLYVSPHYVSFYRLRNEPASQAVEIKAGLEKPLKLTPGDFSLEGEVAYRVEELEKGRRFKVVFQDLPGGREEYRGYLNLKTNYPEKPLVNIKIIGRFVEPEKRTWSDRTPAS